MPAGDVAADEGAGSRAFFLGAILGDGGRFVGRSVESCLVYADGVGEAQIHNAGR